MSDPKLSQRFLTLAHDAQVPSELSDEGLHERFGDRADLEIEAGQVWRARWDTINVLVFVMGIEGRDVIAAPVTIDPPAEDEFCLVVDAFGVRATLWAGLAGPVPIRVLDRPLDAWGKDILDWALAAPSDAVPDRTRRGLAIASSAEPAAEFRAECEDELEQLRLAPALAVANPGHPRKTLASLLGKGPELGPLGSALGLPGHEVRKLLSGTKPVTPDLVEAVADATGLPAEDVRRTVLPLPKELVAEVDHPRWRTTWTTLAAKEGVDEAKARLTASYATFALVGGQVGSGDPDWPGRLRQVLQQQRQGT